MDDSVIMAWLKRNGLRPSPQRFEIAKALLLQPQGIPLRDLTQWMSGGLERWKPAAIKRQLESLIACGAVELIDSPQGPLLRASVQTPEETVEK